MQTEDWFLLNEQMGPYVAPVEGSVLQSLENYPLVTLREDVIERPKLDQKAGI